MTSPFTSNTRYQTNALLLTLALSCALSACNNADPPQDTAATTPDTAITPPDPNDMSSASGDDTTPDAAAQTAPSSGPTMADASTGAPSQADALALLVAINEHEIAAAEQARSKGVDGDTRAFADLMHSEHGKNLAETQALAPAAPDSSPQVKQQRDKGEAELDTMGKLEGDAYEEAYADAMVKGHDEALKMLDTQLIPSAQDDAVKRHFNTTREHVAAHLEKAKALQND